MNRRGGLYGGFVSASSTSSNFQQQRSGGSAGGPPTASEANKRQISGSVPPPAFYSEREKYQHHQRQQQQQQHQQQPPHRSRFDQPPGASMSKHGYSTMSSISSSQFGTSSKAPSAMTTDSSGSMTIKKSRTEEEYFNADSDEEDNGRENSRSKSGRDLPYQPAPGSPGRRESSGAQKKKEDSDSEEDTLDAFMADLEKSAKKSGLKSGKAEAKEAETSVSKGKSGKKAESSSSRGVRADIDEADDEESYYKWLEDNPMAGRGSKFAI